MTYEQIVAEVERRGGGTDRATAETMVVAAVHALADRIPAVAVEPVAGALPAPLAEIVRAGSHQGGFDADEFFERVGAREGTGAGAAREHAQLACAALAEALTPEVRDQLRAHLPEPLAELFEPRGVAAAPPAHPHAREHERRRPLASARPGSTRPLSEAGPEATAQSGSIAASDEPHAERKLSSGQPQRGDTLSSGRPGSHRPLSEGED